MWEDEMWQRRRKQWHWGSHVLCATLTDVKRWGDIMGGGRWSLHVFLLFVPHCTPWPAASPSASPRAAANHADALYRPNALTRKWPVGVA